MMRTFSPASTTLRPRVPPTLGLISDDNAAEIDPYFTVVDDAIGDPIFTAIHELAQRIGRLKKQVNAQLANVANADAPFDYGLFTSRVQQLAGMHQQFAGLVQQFRNSPEYQNDAQTAAMLKNWGLFSVNWSNSVLAALAGTGDALVGGARDALNAVADAAGDVASNLGWEVAKLLIPVGIIGLVLVAGARQAEKSRTYRRYVA